MEDCLDEARDAPPGALKEASQEAARALAKLIHELEDTK